jgi:hypothetical protein
MSNFKLKRQANVRMSIDFKRLNSKLIVSRLIKPKNIFASNKGNLLNERLSVFKLPSPLKARESKNIILL